MNLRMKDGPHEDLNKNESYTSHRGTGVELGDISSSVVPSPFAIYTCWGALRKVQGYGTGPRSSVFSRTRKLSSEGTAKASIAPRQQEPIDTQTDTGTNLHKTCNTAN